MERRPQFFEPKNQFLPMPAISHSSSLANPKVFPLVPSPSCDVRSCANGLAPVDDARVPPFECSIEIRKSEKPFLTTSSAKTSAVSEIISLMTGRFGASLSGKCSPVRNPGATPSPDRVLQGDAVRLYVGFIPVTATQQLLHDKFKVFGPIRQCTVVPPKHGMSYTFGFVQFTRESSAMAAIQRLQGTRWGNWHIIVAPSSPPRSKPTVSRRNSTPGFQCDVGAGVDLYSVCVKRLPLSITVELLGKLFCQVGTVKSVKIMEPQPISEITYAFVQLSTLEEARKAVKQLNNTAIGVQRIQVELAHTTTSASMANMKALKDRLGVKGNSLAKPDEMQGSLHYHNEPTNTRRPNLHNPVISEDIVAAFKKMALPCPALSPRAPFVCLKSSEVVQDSGIQSTTSGASVSSSASSTPVHCVKESHGIEQSTQREEQVDSEQTDAPVIGGSHLSEMQLDCQTDVCAQDPSGPPPLEDVGFPPLTAAEPLPVLSPVVEDAHPATTPAIVKHKPVPFHGVARGRVLSKVLEEMRQDFQPVGHKFAESQSLKPGIGKMQLLSSVLQKLPEDKPQPVGNESAEVHQSMVKESPTEQVHVQAKLSLGQEASQSMVKKSPTEQMHVQEKLSQDVWQSVVDESPTEQMHVQAKLPQDSRSDIPSPIVSRPKRGKSVKIAAVFQQTGKQHTLTYQDIQQHKPQSSHEQLTEGERSSLGKSTLHHSRSQSPEPASPLERYQAVSSGDELEFVDSRLGRSSDELERRIALHQRNIHRWQVETKRIRQRNSAIREELFNDSTDDPIPGWIEEATEERLRAFDRILEMQSRLETETDKLQRRELQHELILAKGEQKYMHDKLALMELKLELEAEEMQDKLTLTKLENKVLQMKAELL